MPSNKELQDDIAARAAELGLTVDTAGMNNATLAATLKGLNDTPAPGADAGADAPVTASGYFVAKGASVTTARGIVADGEALRDGDIPDEARDVLVGLNVIEKR